MRDPRPRIRASRAAWWTATVFGVGRAPFAPGTFGSLAGLALAWIAAAGLGPWGAPALAVVATAAGVAASGAVARDLGDGDPGCVVIDEVAGQAVALSFLPPTPAAWIAGFLAFRAFDIIKPPPVRRLERLPGGLGIVADDLAAGAYAHLAVRLLGLLAPGLVGG